MTEHTALPLKVIEHEANLFSVVDADHFHFASTNSKAHAHSIVTACNCHADLLQACNDALFYLRHPTYQESDTATGVLANILVEAIRKAEEQTK